MIWFIFKQEVISVGASSRIINTFISAHYSQFFIVYLLKYMCKCIIITDDFTAGTQRFSANLTYLLVHIAIHHVLLFLVCFILLFTLIDFLSCRVNIFLFLDEQESKLISLHIKYASFHMSLLVSWSVTIWSETGRLYCLRLMLPYTPVILTEFSSFCSYKSLCLLITRVSGRQNNNPYFKISNWVLLVRSYKIRIEIEVVVY